jgi:hypothetical protein
VLTHVLTTKSSRHADIEAGLTQAKLELLLADLGMEFQEAIWMFEDKQELKQARDEKKAEDDARKAEEEKANAFPWDVLLGAVAQGVSSASSSLSQIQSAHQASLSRIAQLQALPSQHKAVHW